LLLRRLRRRPTITTIHGVLPLEAWSDALVQAYAGRAPKSIIRWIYGRLIEKMASLSADVIMHGASLERSLRQYGVRGRVSVIPQGIEGQLAPLSRSEARRILGFDDRPRVLFFGYLLPYKGLDTLRAAAPALTQAGVEVVVAGSDTGDDRPTHRVLAQDWGPIRRMGYVAEELIPALLSAADVMVLPHRIGLSTSGPFSLAVAYGLPVVVSDVPTLADDLSFPDATFVAGSHESLTTTILRVLNNASVRARLEDRLAEIRAARGWSSVAAATMSRYRDVISSEEVRLR
ncbi:MAG TPA: glycosyltransferase, partial [Actinomycetota bacterium]|nr:glycosyltransferase [Actinomycetota bacterium]